MSAAGGPAVVVRGLECTYPDTAAPALEAIDLTLPGGAVAVVMGASGAGKSTLARCLTRIVPTFVPADVRGDILLAGASIAGRRVGELAGTIAMVFQDFEAQLFSTDVTQEVIFALEQTGVPPAEMAARMRAALGAVGLVGFEGRDPTTLSGGEKQRLAIAGVLALHPPIMVMDEPTTDLDPEGRHALYDVIARLRAEGLALLVVEHDVEAARDADELILLRDGRVAARGRPAAILADVHLCARSGVRPPDVCRVFAALGLPDPPAEVEEAAARMRAAGLLPAPPPARPDPPRSGTPLVEVRGLGHSYAHGRQALGDVTLAIGAGEFVAIIGRNGSGKTTLVKHLIGLLEPTTGEVRLGGRPVAELPLEDLAQRVGYVFQDPDHQLFAATVADEVAFGPRNFGLEGPALAERVDATLDAVGLAAERDEDPFLLRKGERQRLAVATVLAMRPRVLILDEPTTGLDYPQQRRMLELLAELRAGGTTIVVITHSPWVVVEYAERALLMRGGTLVFDGALAALLADEALLRSAAFEAPPAARVARALGIPARTVDELARALGAGA